MLPSRLRSAADRLFRPVDVAALVYFRVAFGLIMLWEVVRYVDHGRIHRYWIEPDFHFHYPGFGWIEPLPGVGMYVLWLALGVLAVLITLGLFYRFAAVLFFLGFTYQFLLAEARYLNHFYLVGLLSFLLALIPAHRSLSLDALRNPGLRSEAAPAWALWLLRFQVGVPYVYGGLAKLNRDWMGRMEPMRGWLAGRADGPLMGHVATEEWFVALANYGSVAIDLLVVPLLLWKRTRPWAFAAAVLFHLLNARWFDIGIFPWLMIAATAVYFDPSWPRRVWRRVAGRPEGRNRAANDRERRDPGEEFPGGLLPRRAVVLFLALWLPFQLLVPLRHHLYPGDVSWTEEGHRFAWRMLLRSKEGTVGYLVLDARTGRSLTFYPSRHLAPWQHEELAESPERIRQLALYIEERMAPLGHPDVRVYARTNVSLNGRPAQPLVDLAVDLTEVRRSLFRHAGWIVPLRPLPRGSGGNDRSPGGDGASPR